MAKVKVTIKKRGYIPGIGCGPINKPIYISIEKYNELLKLGYPVIDVTNPSKVTVSTPVESFDKKKEEIVEIELVEEVVESSKTEEIADNEETVNEVDTVVSEEVEDEVVVDDDNFSAEAYYTDKFLTTKAICKKILDARKVEYAEKASFEMLKKLVAESNPEVEIVEE